MSEPITNPLLKYMQKPTRGQAIKGCTVDRIEPGFRSDIRDCTSRSCPLWPSRPYQQKAEAA